MTLQQFYKNLDCYVKPESVFIFDMDGTLVNSDIANFNAYSEALSPAINLAQRYIAGRIYNELLIYTIGQKYGYTAQALVLSLLGGLIGVVAGIIIALLIGVIFKTAIVISISPIILSFGFSGLVGIGFGYYPAHKASLLNPIDALRYE